MLLIVALKKLQYKLVPQSSRIVLLNLAGLLIVCQHFGKLAERRNNIMWNLWGCIALMVCYAVAFVIMVFRYEKEDIRDLIFLFVMCAAVTIGYILF